MNFAPFAFQNQVMGSVPAFYPTDISDLTFWLDFSDASKMNVSSNLINSITSSFVSASGSLTTSLTPKGSCNKLKLTGSLSQPSLNCGVVISANSTYGATNWNTADNTNIVQGPKTNTTSYPDGMTFMVLNRTYSNELGYLLTRFDGSTDRGAFFTENRPSPGSPQLEIGTYDFGVSAPQIQLFGTTASGSVILTRENNGANRAIYRGSTYVTANSSGNDTQIRTMRQFHNLGRFGATCIPDTQPPLGTYYCELIQYNRVLTSGERTQVWNYLSNKWNIPL